MLIFKSLGVALALYFIFVGTIGTIGYLPRPRAKKTPMYLLVGGIAMLLFLIFI